MDESFTRLLASKKMGAIVFDGQFDIAHLDKYAEKIILSLGEPAIEENLLSIFPEFIGSEEIIQKLRNLVSKKLLKQTGRDWYILNIRNLLHLDFPDKDKAFLCKKIAEYYLLSNNKQMALLFFKKALTFDTKISTSLCSLPPASRSELRESFSRQRGAPMLISRY